ncbi:MAG: dihydrodipicolinate synthase family protein [Gemmatimonadetes bacterium]|nr:dihydrodipicolinate synthase family protein [Gemmatimonadota bacterium]
MGIPTADPVMVAPTPMPFDEADRLGVDALARNVERWLETPLSGFVLGTANGEELFLSEDEKMAAIRAVAKAHGGRRFVIAGIDSPSVTDTLRTAERAAAAGADMVRLRLPRFGNVVRYFEAVLPRSPLPVIVIHQVDPGLFTRPGPFAATPEEIGRVCGMDNVYAYITDHNVRFEARVRRFVPAACKFWACNGSLLLPMVLAGANGACMALGNVAPGLCMDILKLGSEGRFAEAQPLQARAGAADWPILRHGAAGLKYALDLLGFEGGPPRWPTPPLGPEAGAGIEAGLREAELLG